MIKPEDKKFYLEIPDPDFSPQRNEYLVNEAIRKTDEYKLQQRKAHVDSVRERASAVTDYLFSGTSRSIEGYFGKKTLAYLRGEQIVNQLKRPSLFT